MPVQVILNNPQAAIDGLTLLYEAMIEDMAADALALAQLHGFNTFQANAIAHAHQSAQTVQYFRALGFSQSHSAAIAEMFGDMKELPSGSDHQMDSLKDQYNNEVGRRIAEFIELNNLDPAMLDSLVIEALNSGELVSSTADARITKQPPETPTWSGPESWPEAHVAPHGRACRI